MPYLKRDALIGLALVIDDTVTFLYPPPPDHDDPTTLLSLFHRLMRHPEWFLPKSEAFLSKHFDLVLDSLRFVCFPVRCDTLLLSVVVALDASLDSVVEQSRAKLKSPPTATRYGEEFKLSRAGVRVYRKFAGDFANALLFAESVDGYVSKETAQGGEESLPVQLKRIFEGLVKDKIAHFRFNGKTCASFSLIDTRLKPTMEIRPYHSVLLRGEHTVEEVDQRAPAVIEFAKYFAKFRATRSVGDASDDLAMSIEQACRFAEHLRYWHGARVVHKLQDHSLFFVSPNCDLKRSNPLMKKFTNRFTGKDLALVLSFVNEPNAGSRIPRKLVDYIPLLGGGNDQTKVVFSWLLAHDLIVEVFQFIYFVPPQPKQTTNRRGSFSTSVETSPLQPGGGSHRSSRVGLNTAGGAVPVPPPPSHSTTATSLYSNSTSSSSSSSQNTSNARVGSSGLGNSTIPVPPLSPASVKLYLESQNMTVAQLAYVKNLWDVENPVFRMFLCLCPYFGPNNHVDEILFNCNISRGALDIVLDQFSDALFLAVHE